MVSGTLDFSIGFIHYIQDNQKRHSRRERSVLRIKIENQKLKGAVMKNKKSIAILMAAITLASCQSYKKVPYHIYSAYHENHEQRKNGLVL